MDKTLYAVAKVAEQSLFSEVYAQQRGFLQSLDARIKLITVLFILVVISLARTPESLWFLYVTSLVLAHASSVPLGFYSKRVWLFVPLFTAAIVLPALVNVITPGEPLVVLFRLPDSYTWGPYTIPREIAITRQGLWGGITFVSRVAASVSFAVLFTLTTKWSDIFSALRALLVPRVFVMTLAMTHRYLFVLLRLIQDMYRARKSRTIRHLPVSQERSWIASRIGFLFRKSMEMSHDINLAMISRGYHGEVITENRFCIRPLDLIWLVFIITFGVIILAFERTMTQ